jgi:hypothetical protein
MGDFKMTQKTIPIFSEKPVVMVGCGILHKEVDFLIKKNGWNVETQFLASALHNYFDRLHDELWIICQHRCFPNLNFNVW